MYSGINTLIFKCLCRVCVSEKATQYVEYFYTNNFKFDLIVENQVFNYSVN
jgi:hypothetical protein